MKKGLTATAAAALSRRPAAGKLFAEEAAAGGRVRPASPGWPSQTAWEHLHAAVHGRLAPVHSPFQDYAANPGGAACHEFFRSMKNPYYIQDDPALTQTMGWVDAWSTQPSAWVVTPEDATDIAAAVNFARRHNLRLVIKGGGHSYLGNSNAPDSLLIWTRRMRDVTLHAHFEAEGAPASQTTQRAVTLGAGAIWQEAYEAVTTKAGAYVQGGGCTTVGVAGLLQGGGFGSYSKLFGLAAAGLLEAEVVTADGQIRTVNPWRHPDLFWALKGGGGGSFAVVSKVTLRVHDLPEFCGGAHLIVRANSDKNFVRLISRFLEFYRTSLMNPHWGESVDIAPENTLYIGMVQAGLTDAETKKAWKPFLDWIAAESGPFSVELGSSRPRRWLAKEFDPVHIASGPNIGALPMRRVWDPAWYRENRLAVFSNDFRPGASPDNVWYAGNTGEAGFVLCDYDSVWMPAALLQEGSLHRLADTLFQASRHCDVSLHFNKGLAGAPAAVLEEARQTAMNPAVCSAFALAIVAKSQDSAYPGIRGHEPDVAAGRLAAAGVQATMRALRSLVPDGGSYMSESSYFGTGFQASYWGPNYDRLEQIKRKYDPDGLFFTHHGVGSESWHPGGFTRRT